MIYIVTVFAFSLHTPTGYRYKRTSGHFWPSDAHPNFRVLFLDGTQFRFRLRERDWGWSRQWNGTPAPLGSHAGGRFPYWLAGRPSLASHFGQSAWTRCRVVNHRPHLHCLATVTRPCLSIFNSSRTPFICVSNLPTFFPIGLLSVADITRPLI
jgi:hypothetical protein